MSERPRRWAIGLDVGGTKIAGGLLDPAAGETVAARRRPTSPERGGAAVLADVAAMAEALAEEARARGGVAASVGVGVAELVDPDGRITSAQTIDWIGVPVAERLSAVAPAAVEADVRAAALAEGRFGAGAGRRLWLYVTVGTGIASAIVLDGRPLAGARGNALVLATGPLSVPCPRCGALEPVVLEECAAGPAIARRYATATGTVAERAEPVLRGAEAGDATAREIVASAATALGSAIGWLANVTDPEAIVLGGGLGSAGGAWRDMLVAAIRAHIWADATRELPVLPARLGPAAGWIGAAFAGWEATGGGDG